MSQQNSNDVSFTELSSDLRDAVALVQKQFKESLAVCDLRSSELSREHDRRKLIATILKVVSVVSSLVIATGLFLGWFTQVLGGAITSIAALERVLANMSHLLSVAAAKGAYDRIRRQVTARHSKKIIEVVSIRDRDPEKSAKLLIRTVGQLRDLLAETRDKIETDLAANAYENLGRLTLDEEKGGESNA